MDLKSGVKNLHSVANEPSLSVALQDRDTQKIQWIDRFIEELRTNDKWVIPALKQIREICSLFGEAPQNLRYRLTLSVEPSCPLKTNLPVNLFREHSCIDDEGTLCCTHTIMSGGVWFIPSPRLCTTGQVSHLLVVG